MNRPAFSFYKILGLLVSATVAIGSGILGYHQGANGQLVVFYSVATFALILWAWHFFLVSWRYPATAIGVAGPVAALELPRSVAGENENSSYFSEIVRANRVAVIVVLAIAALFIGLSFAVEGFFTWGNAATFLALLAFLALAYWLSRFVTINKSAFIGCAVLLALFVVGSFVIEGFSSTANLKSMLLFAAFLGLACVGTRCCLRGSTRSRRLGC